MITLLIDLFFISAICCIAQIAFCNTTVDHQCAAGQFCKSIEGICVQQFYSTCKLGSDCPDEGACVSIHENTNSLVSCSNNSPGRNKNCICAPRTRHSFRPFCEINTVEVNTTFDDETFCMPCSYSNFTRMPIQRQRCSNIYRFPTPEDRSYGSVSDSCYFNHTWYSDSCRYGLKCVTLFTSFQNKYALSNASYHRTNTNVTGSFFCFPEFSVCSLLRPCQAGELCIRTGGRIVGKEYFECISSDAISKLNLPLQHIRTIPKWVWPFVGIIQISFIVVRSIVLLKKDKKFMYSAVVSFTSETIIGFALLTAHAYQFTAKSIHEGTQDIPGTILQVLLALSQIIVVASGVCLIRKRFKISERENVNENAEFVAFCVRGFISLITLFSSFSLVYALGSSTEDESMPSQPLGPSARSETLLFGIAITFVPVLLWIYMYKAYWVRVIFCTFVFIISTVWIVVILFMRYFGTETIGGTSCELYHGTLSHSRQGAVIQILVIVLGLNNFLTACSSFRLKGYSDIKKISANQVTFIETAVIGFSIPCLLLSYTVCYNELILLVLVALTQVFALLLPLFLEYLFLD